MRLGYSYSRFSRLEQGEGDSVRRQQAGYTAFCFKFGLMPADATFLDKGVSGRHGKNASKGNLARFLALIKSGVIPKGSVLVVEDFDRISRQQIKPTQKLVEGILEAGIDIGWVRRDKIVTASDLNDPMLLMELIWTWYLASEYSEKLSERVGAAHRKARLAWVEGSKVLTKRVPAWLQIVDDKIEEIPARVLIVKSIFELSINGLGIKLMCKKLTADKVKPFTKNWNERNLGNILQDRRVLGELQTSAKLLKGYYPAVVSEDIFATAAKAMRSRFRQRGRVGSDGFVNLFKGLIYYGDGNTATIYCGRDKAGKHIRDYYNSGNRDGSAERMGIRLDFLERNILFALSELDEADFLMKTVKPAEGVQARIDDITARQVKIKTRLKKDTNMEILLDTLAELEAEKKELILQLESSKGSSPDVRETQKLLAEVILKGKPIAADLRTAIRARLHGLVAKIILEKSHPYIVVRILLLNGKEYRVPYQARNGRREGLDIYEATATPGRAAPMKLA